MQRGAGHDAFGSQRGVVKLTFSDRPVRERHYWFVSENGATQLCANDPGFEVNLYLTTTLPDMIYIWRGDLSLALARNEGRIEVIGDVWAMRAFPRWLAKSSYADVKSERRDALAPSSNQRRIRFEMSRPEPSHSA